jgi:hypothetical protein
MGSIVSTLSTTGVSERLAFFMTKPIGLPDLTGRVAVLMGVTTGQAAFSACLIS